MINSAIFVNTVSQDLLRPEFQTVCEECVIQGRCPAVFKFGKKMFFFNK